MDIIFNKEGVPLLMQSTKIFGETTGTPKNIINPFDQNNRRYIQVDNYEVLPWGPDNDFPQLACEKIRGTSVLNTGLKFLRNLTLGQGIYPCTVSGYDDNGNEVLNPIEDVKLRSFLSSRQVRRYMEKVLRDYLKLGHGVVQFVPNSVGSFSGLNPLNALYSRLTKPNDSGAQHCVISGYWPISPEEYSVLPVLSEYDTEMHAKLLRNSKAGFVFCVKDSWSNEDVYAEPIWLPALLSGWVDIAQLVPSFLRRAYKNQITWKWHVQIPYSYWDTKYPPENYSSVEMRKLAINSAMDKIEENLCGTANAEKPLFSNYSINEANGKVEEEWKITALDNKYKGGENLVTSAAANSEILFSLMVNPNVLGAGMPGGTYAGNQGGSNIREAFLVNLANAWIDRQNILDPLELFIQLNGLPNCELRFRNTILTTLDTGAGTKKVLS